MSKNYFEKLDFYAWVWFVGLLGITGSMAVIKYLTLHTSYLDLGIFQYNLANISLERWWTVFGGHAQIFLLFWASLYQVLPDSLAPVVILFLQAAFLSWPVAILYKTYGNIPALAYTLYFPVWYNALFDFHLDHMVVPFLFAFFFLERKNQIWAATGMAFLLVLVKEIFALQTVFCGLYLLIIRRHILGGLFLIGVGGVYYFLAIRYLISYVAPEGTDFLWPEAFSWLGSSWSEMLRFIIMKPNVVLAEIFSDKTKIAYLVYVFGALGFISLLKPSYTLVALPIIGISLLSKEPNHSGFMHHYTAGLIAPLIMAFSEGLHDAKKLWVKLKLSLWWFNPLLILGLLLCHILVSPSPIGRKFWIPSTWHYHHTAYWFTERDARIKGALLLHIPGDPHISVSSQNTLNWGYLAHRKIYALFPYGVVWPFSIVHDSERSVSDFIKHIKSEETKPAKTQQHFTDFVVIDLKRPWFIVGQPCDWHKGRCQNKTKANEFESLLNEAKNKYQTVFEEDGFMILKRDTDNNIKRNK